MTPVRLARGRIAPLELVNSSSVASASVDVLVVPAFAGESGVELNLDRADRGNVFDDATQVALWKSLVDVGARGQSGETTVVPAVPGLAATDIMVVGVGDADTLTDDDIRCAAGNASRALEEHARLNGHTDLTAVSLVSILGVGPAAEGHGLGSYSYPGQRRVDEGLGRVGAVRLATASGEDDPDGADATDSVEAEFARACTVIEAVACARDLVNAPADLLYPQRYASIIGEFARDAGLEVEVLDDEELESQGFGVITGVGRGSARPPRLVRISYRPEGNHPHIALVGKGVTFDTGGISLKPSAQMANMISDMGGSAAVVAAVVAAAELELAVTVTATVPLAENMPGSSAMRPGDILRHYGGTTTEILNTDAEGRLILGDAIARACEDEPDYLLETATLTGAQLRSLGDRTPAAMGTPAFRDRVAALSRSVGEGAWSMPLPAEIGRDIRSDVADLRNISTKGWGGLPAAGHYLGAFVPSGIPWVHLDVAGPAYNTSSPHGYTPRRATGVPVRTIIAVLESIAADRAATG